MANTCVSSWYGSFVPVRPRQKSFCYLSLQLWIWLCESTCASHASMLYHHLDLACVCLRPMSKNDCKPQWEDVQPPACNALWYGTDYGRFIRCHKKPHAKSSTFMHINFSELLSRIIWFKTDLFGKANTLKRQRGRLSRSKSLGWERARRAGAELASLKRCPFSTCDEWKQGVTSCKRGFSEGPRGHEMCEWVGIRPGWRGPRSSLVYSWAVCYVDDKHHDDGGRQPSASNAF